jgi:uncharacterized protein YndB with AHSA1/START domain
VVARRRPAASPGRGGGEKAVEELIEGGLQVEVVQRIDASPATVFSYLVDPGKFSLWMGVGAELDPRPGGVVRIDVDGEHVASGKFVEVDPPHRVVMTWGWENQSAVPPGSTKVEITLTPDGTGTLLRLRHHGFPNVEEKRSHLAGWNLYTGNLAAMLNRP